MLLDRHDPDRSRLTCCRRFLSFVRELASQLDSAVSHGAPKSWSRPFLDRGRDTGAQDTSPPAPVITAVTVRVEAALPVRPEPIKPTPVRCVIISVPLLDGTRLFLGHASRMCDARGRS